MLTASPVPQRFQFSIGKDCAMRVSILGAGSVAYGTAALLAEGGHDPMLWSPSGKRTAALAGGAPLVAHGALVGEYRPRVAGSCAEAVNAADVVMLVLPGYGHKAVMDAAAPHLRADQTVIISSHSSFGALYLSKRLAARNIRPPIVVWGTTITTGRQKGPAEVHVATIRQKVDVATATRHADAAWLPALRRSLRRSVREAGRAPRHRLEQPQSSEPSGHRALQPHPHGERRDLGPGREHHAGGRPLHRSARRRAPGDRIGLRPFGAHRPGAFLAVLPRARSAASRR